ncbi:hypothetical protein MKW92_005353, partial [Papaver armeniacum]
TQFHQHELVLLLWPLMEQMGPQLLPNKMLLHHLKDHCQVVHTLPKLLLQGILP